MTDIVQNFDNYEIAKTVLAFGKYNEYRINIFIVSVKLRIGGYQKFLNAVIIVHT